MRMGILFLYSNMRDGGLSCFKSTCTSTYALPTLLSNAGVAVAWSNRRGLFDRFPPTKSVLAGSPSAAAMSSCARRRNMVARRTLYTPGYSV